jgi:CheY-like chemotaxis protein
VEDVMETENTIKILLVDDEVKFLKAVSDRLAIKGFDVTTATNGDDAVEAANKGGSMWPFSTFRCREPTVLRYLNSQAKP